MRTNDFSEVTGYQSTYKNQLCCFIPVMSTLKGKKAIDEEKTIKILKNNLIKWVKDVHSEKL